jgi:type VI secretion system protein ImpI
MEAPSQASLDPPRDVAVAMAGLRQLASWYLPGAAPPAGVEDVIGFLQTIQDTLDVFLKCFVPLRDGYKQFEVQMDIQRSRGEGQRPYGAPKSSVETSRDPRELARAMLDWRQVKGDEPRTVENTFADLMTHQVALLNGVMKGVKSLLNELSPQTIERTLEDPRKNRGGLQIGPFRFKQLWEMYMERHGDLAAEDKEAFALIFGPQFAQAYAQFVETAQPAPGAPNNATMEIASVHDPLRNQSRTVPPPAPNWPPRR